MQLIERRWVGVLLGVMSAFLTMTGTAREARADDDTCIQASENEIPLRKQSRLHEALVQLSICASPACPAPIVAECGRRIREINIAMPTLALGATDSNGGDLAAVTVLSDGVPIAMSLDGRPVPIDPGQHVLRFMAQGVAPIDKMVIVREGEKDRRVTVMMSSGSTSSTYVPPTNKEAIENHKLAAEVLWGVAGVGAIVGVIAGIDALEVSAVSSADPTLQSSSNTATYVAIGGLSLAAVAGITGTVLWFTTPNPIRPGAPASTGLMVLPTMGHESGGLMVLGTF